MKNDLDLTKLPNVSISKEFFEHVNEPDFDPIAFILRDLENKGVPSIAPSSEPSVTAAAGAFYEKEQKNYEDAKEAVAQKLSSVVMENYNAFVEGMSRVQEVGMDLSLTLELCKNGRARLQSAQDELARGGLTILAKYRKRRSLLALINCLEKIREIMKLDARVRELLDEGDFPQAIQLMLEQKALMTKYKHFESVKAMLSNFNAAYDSIEKKVEGALTICCRNFSPLLYERVLTAFKLLGNTTDVAEKVQKNFVDAIESLSHEVVLAFALKSQLNQFNVEKIRKLKFKELCRAVSDEDLLGCMLQLFAVLGDIMHHYHSMCSWHQQQSSSSSFTTTTTITTTAAAAGEAAAGSAAAGEREKRWFEFKEVKLGMNTFKKTIWDLIQRKVSLFLTSCNYTEFKVDRFLQVFYAVGLFMELGESFSDTEHSFSLRGSLIIESKKFFVNHHHENLNVIKMMFMSENWQPLPEAGFSEIRELRGSPAISHQVSQEHNKQMVRAFLQATDTAGNPFRKAAQQGMFMLSPEESAAAKAKADEKAEYDKKEYEDDDGSDSEENSNDNDNDDDEDDDDDDGSDTRFATLSKQRAEKKANNNKKHTTSTAATDGPILTSISLQVARYLGRYLQSMEILQPIAMEVFTSFSQIFEFYLYNVYAHFANMSKDPIVIPEEDNYVDVSDDLKSIMSDIRESLNTLVAKTAADGNHGSLFNNNNGNNANDSNDATSRFVFAELAPHIDLKNEKLLYGLIERCTAVESLQFLKEIITTMAPKIKTLVPKSNAADVQQFVESMNKAVDQVRSIVYQRTSYLLINLENYPNIIANSKWDRKNSYEHNPYVDQMLKEYHAFGKKLKAVGFNTGFLIEEIPERIVETIWGCAIRQGMEALVEGFSRVSVKKAGGLGISGSSSSSSSGDGAGGSGAAVVPMMMMDCTHFQKGLEAITPTTMRPIPHINLVNTYIKGYYMMTTEHEAYLFAREHMEYTAKQVISLVKMSNLGQTLKKKNLQELIHRIEELHASDPRSNESSSSSSSSSGSSFFGSGMLGVGGVGKMGSGDKAGGGGAGLALSTMGNIMGGLRDANDKTANALRKVGTGMKNLI